MLFTILKPGITERVGIQRAERYRLTEEDLQQDAYDLLETVGRKRGMLMSGGVVNTERAAITLVDEFRGAKLGRVSLERPQAPTRMPRACSAWMTPSNACAQETSR